jgi:hypothetical protein
MSISLTDAVSTISCATVIILIQLTVLLPRSEWCRVRLLTSFFVWLVILLAVVRLGHWALWGSSLTVFLGTIVYFLKDWTGAIVNAILGGELLQWLHYHSDIDMIYYSSHHNCSVTCHVSAIQTNVDISHCNLPGYPDYLRNIHNDEYCVYLRG